MVANVIALFCFLVVTRHHEVELNEFFNTTYTYIDWCKAELNEFEDDTWDDLDWGKIQYQEFNDSTYTTMDWGKIEYNELGNDDYNANKGFSSDMYVKLEVNGKPVLDEISLKKLKSWL